MKADGTKVSFNQNKIITTCMRAGASKKLAKRVLKKIRGQIYHGIGSGDIYKRVLEALDSEEKGYVIKHRYKLKESIMKLGPAGFTFEKYIANLIGHYGFKVVSIGAKIAGKCVNHEIDIIAISDSNERFMIECKYHHMRGMYTGLKVVLYTHARFLDTNDVFQKEALICNTKLSKDARKYAKCVGQKIYSWRYPPNMGLEKIIEQKGLYPITILNLKSWELTSFSKTNVLIAKDLLKYHPSDLSKKTGISIKRLTNLQNLVAEIILEK